MSRQKDVGTRFESQVARYLREALGDGRPERLALHGAKDIGDIGHIFAHGHEGIAECKAYSRVTPSLVERWRAETLDERENADADFGLLVVSIYRAPVARSEVHVTIRDLLRICLGLSAATTPKLAAMHEESWVVMTLEEACALMRGPS